MNKSHSLHKIPGTCILVDSFYKPVSEKGALYILSHFHGDHYGRLSERWDAPVHCSGLTGRLLTTVLGVREDLIRPHRLHEPFELSGASVEFLDAEHCPGAVMILASSAGGESHLHTGDFRATPRLVDAVRCRALPKIQTLFLDSTYALAKSSFPDQAEVIERIASDLAGTPPSTLVLVAAYSVGKERVILRIADRLDCLIFAASGKKQGIYAALDLTAEERARFTDDPVKAQVHVVPFGFCGEIWPYYQPNFSKCESYLEPLPFDAAVGVLPTGHADASNWNRRHEVVTKGCVTLRLYAYSEHSSAKELEEFVRVVRPVKLVPTVFRDQKEQTAIVRRFQHLLDQAGAARQLFASAAAAAANRQRQQTPSEEPQAAAPAAQVAPPLPLLPTPVPEVSAVAVALREDMADGGGGGAAAAAGGAPSTAGRSAARRSFSTQLRAGGTVALDDDSDGFGEGGCEGAAAPQPPASSGCGAGAAKRPRTSEATPQKAAWEAYAMVEVVVSSDSE